MAAKNGFNPSMMTKFIIGHLMLTKFIHHHHVVTDFNRQSLIVTESFDGGGAYKNPSGIL
jgi:hypothetical protein